MQADERVEHVFRAIDAGVMLEVGLIVAAAAALIAATQHALPWIGNRLIGRKRLHLLAMAPVVRLVVIVGAITLILPRLIEPSLQNMVTILGATGLALGFALKDYASSIIAGVVAVGEKTYRNGDWIKVGDVYGEVRHVGIRTIEVVTPEDDRVLIPHSSLWKQSVSNANNGAPRLQCVADFHLHPRHDGEAVRSALEDVALTSPYTCLERPVTVVVTENQWGTRYRLKAYPVDSSQQFRFVSDLTLRGKKELEILGVQSVLEGAFRR